MGTLTKPTDLSGTKFLDEDEVCHIGLPKTPGVCGAMVDCASTKYAGQEHCPDCKRLVCPECVQLARQL